VRRTIVGAALALTLLPLLLLLMAWGYETFLLRGYQSRLVALSQRIDTARLSEEGRRNKVELRLLDAQGNLVADSHSEAISSSLVGGAAEELLEAFEPHPALPETLAQLEATLPPPASRPEVQEALAGRSAFVRRLSSSGHTLLVTLAVPRADGGVLTLTRGSRRGVRRLFFLREELGKLLLYQLVLTVAFAVLFAHGLARPLERLASLVRRFPQQPLNDPHLLGRSDEIGELARAVRELAEDLERRRRATAELGADVAHELKNPLATIAASAQLIADHLEPASLAARASLAAPHILSSVERLRRSIDSLLGLLRLEQSLPEQPRVAVDYRALVDSVLEEYRGWCGFDFQTQIDVGEVHLVPDAWASLLRNLVDNALVQPSPRRELHLVATRLGDQVVTRVRDFGPGVSPGNREKLFRRFYSQRPPGVPLGTGLGLSIVQAVAEAHGGSVCLEEPPDGGGACFSVRFRDAAITLP
jgi:two-component system sensor histidine kinase ChvG